MIAYVPAIIVLSFAAGLLAADSYGRKSWELEIWEAVSGISEIDTINVSKLAFEEVP
jgi:hypothetical protein